MLGVQSHNVVILQHLTIHGLDKSEAIEMRVHVEISHCVVMAAIEARPKTIMKLIKQATVF